MWRCDNMGGLGEHVKKHVLWFLRYTLKNFFLLYSSARAYIYYYAIWQHITQIQSKSLSICICIKHISSKEGNTETIG